MRWEVKVRGAWDGMGRCWLGAWVSQGRMSEVIAFWLLHRKMHQDITSWCWRPARQACLCIGLAAASLS